MLLDIVVDLPLVKIELLIMMVENVTFSYNAHEDESYHEVTISALEFIKLLIRHLVPYQFKTIRILWFL